MKKGDIPFQFVIIILLIIGALIAILFAYFFFVVGHGSTVDAMCKVSAGGRHYLTAHGAVGLFKLSLFPELCSTEPKTIYPSNFEECPYYKWMSNRDNSDGEFPIFKDDKRWYYEHCAAEQFAKLMVSCWDRRGKGSLNPGNFECYTICIEEDKNLQPVLFNKTYLRIVMENANYSSYDNTLTNYKYIDALGSDYFDFAGLGDQIFSLRSWPKNWKDETAYSGQLVSIWFKDGQQVLFGFKQIKKDMILIRYKTMC